MAEGLPYKKVNSLAGNNKIFYDTFIQAGYTPVQAFGMIGNLIYESAGRGDIKTNAKEIGGQGYGAAQWSDPTRKQGLFNFAASKGLSPESAQAQAMYIVHELNTSYSKTNNRLKQAGDVKTAMEIFLKEFENPKAEHQHPSSLSYKTRYENATMFGVPQDTTAKSAPKVWKWKTKSNNVNIKNLDANIIEYLHTLEPEYQDYIIGTSGNDGKVHSSTSRHYKNKAVDLGFNQKLYDRVYKDPIRLKYGITLLDPNHGTAPHLHLSAGDGTENQSDVWVNPFSDQARKIVSSLKVDNSQIQQHNQQQEEEDGFKFRQSQGQFNSELLAYMTTLNEKLNKEDEQKQVEERNKELRSKLIQKQQERDFLVANVMASKLPFIERG